VDLTDERDASQQMPAELDVRAVPSPAATPVVVGDIPEQRPGSLPRPDLLAQLDGSGAAAPVRVLTGTPGAGKTQLAAAYARAKLTAGWRLVAWVDAENAASLLAGLTAVAVAVGVSQSGSGSGYSLGDSALAIRRWLESDGERCLLVLDNAGDPEVLRPFVPVAGAAQVLITAARASVAELGVSIPVDVFRAKEALAFLAGRTGLADETGASALAAELGYLPLALDLAASVIAGQFMGYRAYLGRLATVPAGEHLAVSKDQPDLPGTVEAVLLSLEASRTADPGRVVAGVLDVMGALSAAGVRRELLHAAGEAGVLARNGSRVAAGQVDQALAQLAGQALLTFTVDGQSVIMHSLVGWVVRAGLARRGRLAAVYGETASAQQTYARTLAGTRHRTTPNEGPEPMTGLPDDVTGPAGESDGDLIQLRLRCLELYRLTDSDDGVLEAVAVGEPLTADLERVLGPDHPETLHAAHSLAAAYRAAGRVAEAIPLIEQTLVGRVRVLGPDHPDTLALQNALAAAYQQVGRAVEAILLFRLTLAARERLLGPDHASTLNSRENLAYAYRGVGRIAEAIPLFGQILATRERLLGPDHPDAQRSRSSLAAAYKETGRPAEAIPLVEQILRSRQQALGADHPKTLSSRNNLAAAYLEAGRADEAIPLFEQTLATCERLLGTDDARTQATRNNLALARRQAGQAFG
jgi:tetratricopeptide (TPR) repeat protein